MKADFQKRVGEGGILIVPGVADTLGAVLAERAGFAAAFLSGSAMGYTCLGRPDIGLLSLAEVADITRRIAERCSLALIVDADSGFGNAYHVHRSVRTLELAGAKAIQLEDQVHDKHPRDIEGRPVIPLPDMLDKLKAALDVRHQASTLISARSDAAVSLGTAAALERAHAFAECGADMVFVEGLPDAASRQRLVTQIGGAVPLLYNLAWGPEEDRPTVAELDDEGFSVAFAPADAVLASMKAVATAFHELARQNVNVEDRPPEKPHIPDSVADAVDARAFIASYRRWSDDGEH